MEFNSCNSFLTFAWLGILGFPGLASGQVCRYLNEIFIISVFCHFGSSGMWVSSGLDGANSVLFIFQLSSLVSLQPLEYLGIL